MTEKNPPINHTEEYEGKRLNFQDLPEEEQQEHLRSLEALKIESLEKAERKNETQKEILSSAEKTKKEIEAMTPQTTDSSLGTKEDANLEGKTIWKKPESTKENLEQKKEKGLLSLFKKYWKKAALVTGFTVGSAIASQAAKAGGGEDSLGKKSVTEKVASVKNTIEVKEGLKIRDVSPTERQDWNAFIDFVESKGLQGSEKLDKGSDVLAKSLFSEYKKLHPKTTLTYELVPSIQYEMQKLKQNVQGFAERRNDPNAKNLMSFVSKVDGWFGSRTSQSKFPFMIENDYHNNNLVSSENLGLIGADMTPEKKAELMKKIPKGAKLEKLEGGIFYENEDGDMVKVSD